MGKKNNQKKQAQKSAALMPETLKNNGNAEMMKGNFWDAVLQYDKAIELCNTNAIYFSNRKFVQLSLQLLTLLFYK